MKLANLLPLKKVKKALNEATLPKAKSRAIKALAGHLAAAQGESDDDVNSVLDAQEEIKKAINIQDIVEILGNFGFEDDEIGSIITTDAMPIKEALDDTAAYLLNSLAAPEIKRYMDRLADELDEAQFMRVKKLYDGLYTELKKHE